MHKPDVRDMSLNWQIVVIDRHKSMLTSSTLMARQLHLAARLNNPDRPAKLLCAADRLVLWEDEEDGRMKRKDAERISVALDKPSP